MGLYHPVLKEQGELDVCDHVRGGGISHDCQVRRPSGGGGRRVQADSEPVLYFHPGYDHAVRGYLGSLTVA